LFFMGHSHRGLREAGIPAVCIEVRNAQRFLSTRPVKTDRNDARGIADMTRLGHFRPVHVKSLAAQAVRTTLAVRLRLVASQLQIENTIRGLLKVYGLGWPVPRTPSWGGPIAGRPRTEARSG
jgi:transposase